MQYIIYSGFRNNRSRSKDINDMLYTVYILAGVSLVYSPYGL